MRHGWPRGGQGPRPMISSISSKLSTNSACLCRIRLIAQRVVVVHRRPLSIYPRPDLLKSEACRNQFLTHWRQRRPGFKHYARFQAHPLMSGATDAVWMARKSRLAGRGEFRRSC